jgi:hypothetical protein
MYSFVIASEQLACLNNLEPGYPRPTRLEWINRGTDQKLRQASIDLIIRTLYQPISFSESVQRLHKSSGLRVVFASERDRAVFAEAFRAAASPTKPI